MEHRPGAPCDPDVAGLDHFERDHRGVDQVPQLVSEEPEPLVLSTVSSGSGEVIPFAPVLGDRARDGAVEASVQETKVPRADRRVPFHCQFCDGLAYVAVAVHDLGHGEPLKQEVVPVEDRALADLRTR